MGLCGNGAYPPIDDDLTVIKLIWTTLFLNETKWVMLTLYWHLSISVALSSFY